MSHPYALLSVSDKSGIVDFAKEADIKVIASCVNTKEIFELIKLLGIDYAQAHDLSIPQDIKN